MRYGLGVVSGFEFKSIEFGGIGGVVLSYDLGCG